MRPIDKDAFAQIMMAAIARAGDARTITYDASAFVLMMRDLDEVTASNAFFLGNAHREYGSAADDAQRADVVRRWVAMAQSRDTGESFAEALVNLMPRVRERAYYGIVPLQLRARGVTSRVENVSHTPIGDVLAMSLTRDMPATIEEVSAEQLARWNVNYERALEVAMANLARRSGGSFEPIAQGLYASPWHDNYDASRLLLPDLIRGVPVRGAPVVIAANRDCLLVTGDDDPQGLLALADVAERVLQDPRPLTGCAVRLGSDGIWSSTLPPPGHPAHAPLWRLAASSRVEEYYEQKELLQPLYEADGVDVFVASFEAVVNDDGGGFTYAVLSNGVDTLLPDSDVIMLLPSEDADPIRAPAAAMRAMLPHLFEPQPALYPRRWRVRAFPNASELRALSTLR